MFQSKEVYMTDEDNNLSPDGMIMFSGGTDKEFASYHSELYVCLTCGYMSFFARPSEYKGKHQELMFLQKAKGWKKAA